MFETAELGSHVPKDEYAEREPQLRVDLLNAQFDLNGAGFRVVVLLAGDDRIGTDEVVDLFHEWMDARFVRAHFFGPASDEERERPRFWRYWRALPPRGRIGVFIGAWAFAAIADRVAKRIADDGLSRRIDHIRSFEKALVDDGALVLKFWFHLPKKEYRKRLEKAGRKPGDDWRVEDADREIFDVYDDAMPVVEHVLRKTSTAEAPWSVVESTDARYRNLMVATTILNALTPRLSTPVPPPAAAPAAAVAPAAARVTDVLSKVDLTRSLTREKYKKRLEAQQARLAGLSRRARAKGVSSVVVFEGWDAAGKGGVIRRVTRPMNARDYVLVPIAAPTDEERAHHYLWRFWRHLPRAGRTVIFDRSWYGRILVERVEGFARPDEWGRAYAEINDFEEQLVDHGMPVLKFWLHIDRDEQLRRFRAREHTPYKKYKITDEDYRNREKWDRYVAAVNEMVERTSTEIAPWHLVAADDKRWARVQVLETVCDAVEKGLAD